MKEVKHIRRNVNKIIIIIIVIISMISQRKSWYRQ